MNPRTLIAAGLLLATAPAASAQQPAPADEARELAREVYQYAYPLVLMDVTLRQTTNVPNATAVGGRAPVNQFAHFRSYPKADAKDVVRFNFDTLYSFAWVDLSQGPLVLSVPDTGGRFYLVPTLDMWTDVFSSIGSRTTGTKAGHFAYVPPGWKGELPSGVERIDAPTPVIWVMGRIQTNGPADYANVHKVQDGLKLTPLDRWGKDYAPPAESPVDDAVDGKTPPLVQVDKMSGVEFFTRFAELLKKHPPHAADSPILFRMRALGLVPGKVWDASKLDAATLKAINAGAKDAMAAMQAKIKAMGTKVNGWNVLNEFMGVYGTSYLHRAGIALGGLGANLPEDAVYPTAFVDGDGRPLDAKNKYVVHFPKGQTPPAGAFWSITMYDGEGFQVPNPIDRFAIGDRDKLKFNEDGSLDIYVQPVSPGKDKESNWLPAPKSGPIGPTMRIYAPKREVLDGTWSPPPFKRVGAEKADAVPVTVGNFVRAESDTYFDATVKGFDAFGKFGHNRQPTPIDKQTVIRMNRDTLYSAAVFDLDAGPVSITLPDAGKRFLSMQVISQDHYTPMVVYGGGKHTLTREKVGTRYVITAVRILADPNDPKDIAEVVKLQDAIKVEQPGGPGQFEVPSWDPVSQKRVRDALNVLADTLPDKNRMFGAKGEVDPVRHLLGAASAWGGNPDKDAVYLNVVPKANDGKTVYRLTVKDVPVDGFWSVCVYNQDGFFEKNAANAYALNNLTAKKNDDGSVTIQFGGDPAKTPNCLPTPAGWSYMVRLYRPRKEILDGTWKFPDALPQK